MANPPAVATDQQRCALVSPGPTTSESKTSRSPDGTRETPEAGADTPTAGVPWLREGLRAPVGGTRTVHRSASSEIGTLRSPHGRRCCGRRRNAGVHRRGSPANLTRTVTRPRRTSSRLRRWPRETVPRVEHLFYDGGVPFQVREDRCAVLIDDRVARSIGNCENPPTVRAVWRFDRPGPTRILLCDEHAAELADDERLALVS